MASDRMGTFPRIWRRLDNGTVWPVIETDPEVYGLENRLRYSPDSITPADLLYLASIVSAYETLLYYAPEDSARRVTRALRAARQAQEKDGYRA